MNEMDFMQWIGHLEECHRFEYSPHEKRSIKSAIYTKLHPTDRELKEVAEMLESVRWAPKIHDIKEALTTVRKRQVLVYVDCPKCDRTGFLYYDLDDGHRMSAGCGCENTPRHIPKKQFVSYYTQEKGLDAMRFYNVHGRFLHENDEDFNTRKWQEMIDYYDGGKWVPKWMRERFDMGYYDRPGPDEWPRSGRGQLDDMPMVGENHGGV